MRSPEEGAACHGHSAGDGASGRIRWPGHSQQGQPGGTAPSTVTQGSTTKSHRTNPKQKERGKAPAGLEKSTGGRAARREQPTAHSQRCTPEPPGQGCICFLASPDCHIQNYLGGRKDTFKHREEGEKATLKCPKNSEDQAVSSNWSMWPSGTQLPGGHPHCSKIKSHLAWIDSRSLKADLRSRAAICIKWLKSCPMPKSVCG